MRLLHTADWHIGQLFYDQDRTEEHCAFMEWLLNTLEEEAIDALLISGDIFDVPNPSTSSVRMFYKFLSDANKRLPRLQIIATAGNHDSAARLETPRPLLESSSIHLIGTIEKTSEGRVDYNKLIIPLYNHNGHLEAHCIAIPFLRMGDYPLIAEASQPYKAGVEAFYQEAADFARECIEPGTGLIAMGHLHATSAELSGMDDSERSIMGGLESISAAAFDRIFTYVALGHIHKAQALDGKKHIRYSGSPLPMSFTERSYQHQVVIIEIQGSEVINLYSKEVPVKIPLWRIPSHQPLPESEVMQALAELEQSISTHPAPYLEVQVLTEGPEPGLIHRIQQAVKDKHVRLVKVSLTLKGREGYQDATEVSPDLRVRPLNPEDVLRSEWGSRFQSEIPADLIACFREIQQELHHSE